MRIGFVLFSVLQQGVLTEPARTSGGIRFAPLLLGFVKRHVRNNVLKEHLRQRFIHDVVGYFNTNDLKCRARDDFILHLNHRTSEVTTATTTVSNTDHTLSSLKPKQGRGEVI